MAHIGRDIVEYGRTVFPRFFDRLKTPATGPAWVSNNPCQESVSAWLLCHMFFDTTHAADLLATAQSALSVLDVLLS
jgi:hypothetical protein